MPSQRTQVRGHCQVCGRDVAVTKGLVAKHGYSVTWHQFIGSCAGADFPPIEVSSDRLAWFCERLDEQQRNIEARLAELRDGTATVVVERVRKGAGRYDMVECRPADFPRLNAFKVPVTWEQFLQRQAEAVNLELRNFTYHAGVPRRVLAGWTAQPDALRVVEVAAA